MPITSFVLPGTIRVPDMSIFSKVTPAICSVFSSRQDYFVFLVKEINLSNFIPDYVQDVLFVITVGIRSLGEIRYHTITATVGLFLVVSVIPLKISLLIFYSRFLQVDR